MKYNIFYTNLTGLVDREVSTKIVQVKIRYIQDHDHYVF